MPSISTAFTAELAKCREQTEELMHADLLAQLFTDRHPFIRDEIARILKLWDKRVTFTQLIDYLHLKGLRLQLRAGSHLISQAGTFTGRELIFPIDDCVTKRLVERADEVNELLGDYLLIADQMRYDSRLHTYCIISYLGRGGSNTFLEPSIITPLQALLPEDFWLRTEEYKNAFDKEAFLEGLRHWQREYQPIEAKITALVTAIKGKE